MKLFEALDSCIFNNYANFKGRATRSEYWWYWSTYVFFIIFIPLVSFILDEILYSEHHNGSIWQFFIVLIFLFIFLGGLMPFMAVSVRRLRDSGLGWGHFLWRFIPFVGSIITIVLMCRNSKSNENNLLIENFNLSHNYSTSTNRDYNGIEINSNKSKGKSIDAGDNSKKLYCKYCGRIIEAHSHWCKYCGKKLDYVL